MPLDLGSLHVLVVDDNAHLRVIASAMLRAVGVTRIKEAEEGGQAIEAIRDWRPDVVVTDLTMAPMDGITLTRWVRTDPDSPNIFLPVVMMTGHADLPRVMAARDAGVNEILVKPLTARGLLDRLQATILNERPFVRSPNYVGPCRRRRANPGYAGPWRRANDPRQEHEI